MISQALAAVNVRLAVLTGDFTRVVSMRHALARGMPEAMAAIADGRDLHDKRWLVCDRTPMLYAEPPRTFVYGAQCAAARRALAIRLAFAELTDHRESGVRYSGVSSYDRRADELYWTSAVDLAAMFHALREGLAKRQRELEEP